MQAKFQYLSPPNFFGPTHNWREKILEEFFLLQLHLNMSYSEVKRLPVRYRRWYLERLAKHFKEKNEIYEKSSYQDTQTPLPKFDDNK